ncbi:MAG: hypothetical protein KDK70_08360, partial [Myxococcales bacterium]|nr:hypothetical protein [Myxococcales bacterium]
MSPTVHLRVSKTERSLASPAFGRGALDFDPRELETPGEAVAEVVVSHGATVLDVQHVGQTRGRDRYTLGETPEASFPVSADALPGGQTFVLVQRHGDRYALRFTAQMRGEVHWSGRTLDLRALVAQGLATPTAGGHRFVLPDGARARLEHGRVTYQVATVARARSIARKAEADKPLWLCNAGSAAVLGTLLALVHLVPDDALAMSLDDITADNRFVGYIHQPDRPEPAERGLDGDARGATEPSSSAAASGPAPASGAKAHPQG